MNKNISKALYYLIILIIIILLIVLLGLIKAYDVLCCILDIVVPIFFGYVFAWLLKPIYDKIKKKIRSKKISFVLVIMFIILIYASLVLILVPLFVNEFANFINTITSYIESIKNMPFIDAKDENMALSLNTIINSCGGVVSIVVNFALINMFGFYILYNYELVYLFIKNIIPIKFRRTFRTFSDEISRNMRAFVKGTLIDTFAMFGMTLILFLLFDLKYSILLALFVAVTNIIPFIGPYIGGIPAVIVGFSTSINEGIAAIIIVVVCQLIESNVINPLIMSRVTKINPLILVIAITIIGKFFGILGMAFSVPILIFIKISFEFYKNNRIVRE